LGRGHVVAQLRALPVPVRLLAAPRRAVLPVRSTRGFGATHHAFHSRNVTPILGRPNSRRPPHSETGRTSPVSLGVRGFVVPLWNIAISGRRDDGEAHRAVSTGPPGRRSCRFAPGRSRAAGTALRSTPRRTGGH